jgi:hypothetical protein
VAIPKSLLAATDSRGVGIATYGGPGLKKTNFVHTLPPPILHLDIGEGGTSSLLPWIRRRRDSHESSWTDYTQEQRQAWFDLLHPDVKAQVRIKPAAYIDVVHFDNSTVDAYSHLVDVIGNFDTTKYNSLVGDSLQELAIQTQTFSKGVGNETKLMGEVPRAWFGAQERAGMAIRKLRNIRDSGIFVYLTGGEDIAKDYVSNPLEKRAPGAPPPEPYSVRGTVNLPGQLAGALSHIPDILMHARLFNGDVKWVTAPEMLPGGGAHWDAKDRFGRLDRFESPNFREMSKRLYGEQTTKDIYAYAAKLLG